jgi:hypothetical protein
MPICPYCRCGDRCNREPGDLDQVPPSRCLEVFNALLSLFSFHPEMIDLDPLLIQQELIYFGYFAEDDAPLLVHVGHAQDLVREVER